MKTLYLDLGMGAAGDMLTAALVELLPDPDAFIAEMNALGIPSVEITKEVAEKCGIRGTYISVKINGIEEGVGEHKHAHEHTHEHVHEHTQDAHNHEHTQDAYTHEHIHNVHNHEHTHTHHHSSMHDIEHIISHLQVSEAVKKDILAVYRLIAEAESHAHGVPVTEIHFHEVGTMDAIADVTAVCLLMSKLAPDEVVVSPVHVGSGQVKCAHGILPVPAPATAYILKDVPIYGGAIQGELCTPTGAALIKHFATDFGAMPIMKTEAIGYGMGKKDFETANCVRAMLGETEGETDTVLELSCNVDDMTAENMGYAMDCLLQNGALDVYTIPIGMKKSRPATLLCVLCSAQDREKIITLLFKHTTTLGVRESVKKRYVLKRHMETVDTPYGKVHRKISEGYGVTRSKYEYDDIARIAKEKNVSMEEVRKLLEG